MGGEVRITLYAPSPEIAERAATSAYARIAALEDVMSDYRPTSEVSRLAAQAERGPVVISADLARVLGRAQALARASGGAFDVTCGPLVALWRDARKTGALPAASAISAARARVGWRNLRVDSVVPTAELRRAGLRLDLGGIAKGDAGDEARRELHAQGVTRALIEAGGDLVAGDAPPGQRGWRVQIRGERGPGRWLVNQAMSTSGDAAQFVAIKGVRYSHIVDPRDGYGVTHRNQVTVIARSGLVTDPLATALSVLGPRAGARLIAQEGVQVVWIAPQKSEGKRTEKWSMLEP